MVRRAAELLVLSALPALLGQAPADPGGDAGRARERRERLLEIYRAEAERYVIYRDATRRDRVELRREPVYVWTNPLREGGQDGAVFLWTCRGRAEALGTFFSFPAVGTRSLVHELHSLAPTVLDVSKPGGPSWTPEGPGVDLRPVAGAPAPAKTPAQRLLQMRNLSREFTGNTVDREGKRWALRLLPQPLHRYESTDPDVPDGTVFAFVTSAGTDPEVILLIEARRPAPGAEPVWQAGVARFTDLDLWVRHRGTEIFRAAKIVEFNTPRQDETHRYLLFTDRYIDPFNEANGADLAVEKIRTTQGGKP